MARAASAFTAVLILCHTFGCMADPRDRIAPAMNNRGTGGITSSVAQNAQQRRAARAEAVPLTEQLNAAIAAGDYPKALSLLDRLDRLGGSPETVLAARRFEVLLRSGDTDAAYRLAARAEQLPEADARLFGDLARAIVDTPNLAERDVVLARRLARQAVQLSNGAAEYQAILNKATPK